MMARMSIIPARTIGLRNVQQWIRQQANAEAVTPRDEPVLHGGPTDECIPKPGDSFNDEEYWRSIREIWNTELGQQGSILAFCSRVEITPTLRESDFDPWFKLQSVVGLAPILLTVLYDFLCRKDMSYEQIWMWLHPDEAYIRPPRVAPSYDAMNREARLRRQRGEPPVPVVERPDRQLPIGSEQFSQRNTSVQSSTEETQPAGQQQAPQRRNVWEGRGPPAAERPRGLQEVQHSRVAPALVLGSPVVEIPRQSEMLDYRLCR
jgi:hypothetical protein